jgi:hypothetical protein
MVLFVTEFKEFFKAMLFITLPEKTNDNRNIFVDSDAGKEKEYISTNKTQILLWEKIDKMINKKKRNFFPFM